MFIQLPTSRAISRALSILIVVVVVAAAFGGYLAGSHPTPMPNVSTVTKTEQSINTIENNYTLTVPFTTTRTVTTIETNSGNETLVTLTEYVYGYFVNVVTQDIFSNSSATFSCIINPTRTGFPVDVTTSIAPLKNVTGTVSVTLTTTFSVTSTTTSTTTVSVQFPLTTSVTTQNGSTETVTTCSAETG